MNKALPETRGPRRYKSAPQWRSSLERKLEAKLHDAGVVHRRVQGAKTGRTDVAYRAAELRMIEEVEKFRAEIQAHPFSREGELFDDGKVGVHKARAGHRDARRMAQSARYGRDKTGRVDPLIPAVVGRVRVATRNAIRAVEVVPV